MTLGPRSRGNIFYAKWLIIKEYLVYNRILNYTNVIHLKMQKNPLKFRCKWENLLIENNGYIYSAAASSVARNRCIRTADCEGNTVPRTRSYVQDNNSIQLLRCYLSSYRRKLSSPQNIIITIIIIHDIIPSPSAWCDIAANDIFRFSGTRAETVHSLRILSQYEKVIWLIICIRLVFSSFVLV